MKFFLLVAFLWTALVSPIAAYAVTGGSVSLNKEPVLKIDPKSQDTHRISLDSAKDIVSLSVDISATAQPHQLMFFLTNNNGLDHAVYATFKNDKANAVISVNKLPSALKSADRVFVSIIAADANEEEKNINFTFLELIPSDLLKDSVGHKSAVRLGALPEIHHIFKTDAATVNPIIPLVFSAIAVALLVILLGAWVSVLSSELFGASSGSTYKAAFLTTLGYLEFTFFRYYLGASIFTTISQVALAAGFFLFFASRALTALGRSRADGKA